jgi:hypothetical protein
MIGLMLILAYAAATTAPTYSVLSTERTPAKNRSFIARTLWSLVQERQDKADEEVLRWRKILENDVQHCNGTRSLDVKTSSDTWSFKS